MSGVVQPPLVRERLPSGLEVVVARRAGIPLAAIRLLLRAGSALDPPGRAGLASLVALSARRGTRRLPGERLDAAVEATGGELGIGVDEDAAVAGLSVPVGELGRSLGLVADVAATPGLAPAEVARLRRREVAGLAHDASEPGVLADRALLRFGYGDHPYGHPSEGLARDLRRTTRAEVVAFHALRWRPSRATVVLVGPIDVPAALALVRRRFGGWRAAPGGDLEVAPVSRPRDRRVVIVDRPEQGQAQIRLGFPGLPRASAEHAAGVVAGAVLGGGFTSRLMEAIRVDRGLSYGVRGRFASARAGGLFVVSSFTKVESAGELVRVALAELARFADEGPTAEELDRMRAYLGGLHPLSLETHEAWAEKLVEVELYGLGPDEVTGFRERLAAVDAAACRALSARSFGGEGRLVVAVGPARRLAPQLEHLGPVTVVAPGAVM